VREAQGDSLQHIGSISFDSPDHIAIVMHDYRWRLGLAPGEARYDSTGSPCRKIAPPM